MSRHLLALAVLALATAADAQTEPPLDPGSAVVSELVVTARWPGPAMWKVEKGGASVYILGAVTPIRHLQAWDSVRVEHALDGARQLLIPPQPHVGPIGVTKVLVADSWRLRQSGDLEASLPPPLRARFVSARERAGQPAKRYEHWNPAMAGFLLLSDFRQAAGLAESKPVSTVVKLAKDRHVPVRETAKIGIGEVAASAARLTAADNLRCLDLTLGQLEHEGADPFALGRAWAEADLAAVRRLYRPSPAVDCLMQAPGGAALIERNTAQSVRTLEQALAGGGKTVAVIDLSQLLRANGVLDRLRAAGATVTVPGE